VSDEDIPSSGSRWEPADDAAPPAVAHPEVQPPPPVDAADAAVASAAGPRRPRRRSALAAAGVGLVLAGGLGGFAVGHAIAGTTDPVTVTDSDQDGVPDGGPGGRPDFRRDGTAPGAPGDGTVPGQSAPDDPGADDGGTA